MRRLFLAAFATICLALPGAAEDLAARLFGGRDAPSAQASMPTGSYARGCLAGGVEMAQSGPTWQVMRLGRARNWGHPTMIAYLQDLSVAATRVGWKGIYIGDIGQARGGPMLSGHASHQTGLDVDIWYTRPRTLGLSVAEREKLSAITVRTDDQLSVNGNWTPSHAALLQLAAADPRVDRIFVAAAIKIEMCRSAKAADKGWLQKIRPLYGHHDHFHVRLKCPKGATACEPQKPSVAELSNGGNGCDDTLTWWVTEYLHPPKPDPNAKPKPHVKTAREFTMADLPKQCAAVLASP